MSQRVSIMAGVAKPAREETALPDSYLSTLEELKAAVRAAQIRARVVVNTELVRLYWQIGRTIVDRQAVDGWGAKVIERLANDLRAEFPIIRGFSRRNLHYMRKLATDYPDPGFVQQAAARIPWGHLMVLLDKVEPADREWYAAQARASGWSRAVLEFQISTEAHARLGAASTNFAAVLPAPESDLARELVKDPYIFDFLTAGAATAERELERQLVDNLARTLLELGRGFAFVGQQFHFELGGDDFYIDLLFYNVVHHRYVVVELKAGTFEPSFTGQLNFYVAWVDQHLRGERDDATIGLLLCASRNDQVVEVALSGTSTAMAVADWKALPASKHEANPEVDAVIAAVEQSGAVQLTLRQYFGGAEGS